MGAGLSAGSPHSSVLTPDPLKTDCREVQKAPFGKRPLCHCQSNLGRQARPEATCPISRCLKNPTEDSALTRKQWLWTCTWLAPFVPRTWSPVQLCPPQRGLPGASQSPRDAEDEMLSMSVSRELTLSPSYSQGLCKGVG